MTGWGTWSTGNCARNWNLTIWVSGINRNQRVSGEWDAHNFWGIWDTNVSFDLGHTNRRCDRQQKKRTCRILDFKNLPDHRVKLKEQQKSDKYLDTTRYL